jgi:FkbM family methyltransferase
MKRNPLAVLRNINRSHQILRCVRETGQWLPITLAYLGLKDLSYPFSLKIRGLEPVTLKEDGDLLAFWQIFLRRVYPVQGDEEVIVDAGANIGFFTLFAARQSPHARIFSIEPFPESYERLCQNVRNNRLNDRVTSLNCALGKSSETRMMKLSGKRSQSRRVVAFDETKSGDAAAVSTQTIEQVFDLHAITRVDLLKMDIEGGEYEAFFSTRNDVLRRIHSIALEYHPDVENYSTSEMLRYLVEAGFRVTRDIPNHEGFGMAHLELVTGSRPSGTL